MTILNHKQQPIDGCSMIGWKRIRSWMSPDTILNQRIQKNMYSYSQLNEWKTPDWKTMTQCSGLYTHIYRNKAVTDLADTVNTAVWNYNIEQKYNRKASQNSQFNVLTQMWHNSYDHTIRDLFCSKTTSVVRVQITQRWVKLRKLLGSRKEV